MYTNVRITEIASALTQLEKEALKILCLPFFLAGKVAKIGGSWLLAENCA